MPLPHRKTLDSMGYMEHYYIYANGGLHRDADAEERSQTRNLAGTRDFKPTSPRRDRPAVCHRQLLRSQRSGPDQVRDAAPRAERGPFGDRRRDGFWLLAALVPHKRGPKRAHKLTDEVLAFLVDLRQKEPSVRTPDLVRLIQEHFGTKVHPRSIERSLLRHQK